MNRIINGVTYIEFDDSRMRYWGILDILTINNQGGYIGAEGDIVTDTDNAIQYIITDVDPITGISKLESYASTQNTLLWAYYDTNTTPTSITIDGTFTVSGDVEYALAFNGIHQNNNTMSEVYHSDGTYETDRIPVRRISSDSHEQHLVYNIDRFHTTETLANGGLITLVVFDMYGNVITKRVFTLSDVSPLNALTCVREIQSVDLMSPFMDSVDLIRRPITIAVADLNLTVKITYADGEEEILAEDDPRVQIAGLDVVHLNNTALEHEIMVIFKTMGDPVNGPLETNGIITVPYHLRNYTPSLSYNHQLQIYPVYINQIEGYRIVGRLTLADRSDILDVSPYLTFTTPLDGLLLNVEQVIEASIDLAYVHQIQDTHSITITEYVTIHNYGGTVDPGWSMVGPMQYIKPYNITHAVGISTVRITNNPLAWWDTTYTSANPMIISGIEIEPPTATHLKIYDTLHGDIVIRKDQLNETITFPELLPNRVIHCEFIQLLGGVTIHLAYMPLIV